MITPEQHAEIRRLYFGEHWKVGTIAAALGVHHDTVRAAIAHDTQGVRRGTCRATQLDPVPAVHPRHARAVSAPARDAALRDGARAAATPARSCNCGALVRTLRPAAPPTVYRRLTTLMAEEAQVDWGAFGVDPDRPRRAAALRVCDGAVVFARALCALHARPDAREFPARACRGLSGAFRACARTLVYDNLRSAVLERAGHRDSVSSAPARARRATITSRRGPVRPGAGNEKGKIERQIQYLRQAFFAARTFADVDDLNAQFRRWRDDIAHQRPHPEHARSDGRRRSSPQEQPRLLPLPAHPFETDVMRTVGVRQDPVRALRPQ